MHIESRPSKADKGFYDFFVSCDDTKGGLRRAVDTLKDTGYSLHVLSRNIGDSKDSGECPSSLPMLRHFHPKHKDAKIF